MSDWPERHIVMACSASKRDRPCFAGEMYRGVVWHAWRTAYGQGTGLPFGFHRWVLSAEHGLIPTSAQITPYNRSLTPRRVEGLAQKVAQQWADRCWRYPDPSILPADSAGECLVVGGELYQRVALRAGLNVVARIDGTLHHGRGGIGILRQRVKHWAGHLRSSFNADPCAGEAWEIVKAGSCSSTSPDAGPLYSAAIFDVEPLTAPPPTPVEVYMERHGLAFPSSPRFVDPPRKGDPHPLQGRLF